MGYIPYASMKAMVDKFVSGALTETDVVKWTTLMFFEWLNTEDPMIPFEANRIKTIYVPTYGKGNGVVRWIRDFYYAYSDRMDFGKIP